MKIALVHDYFNEAGGAERVLRVLSEMYPSAPIYTAFVKNGSAKRIFKDRVVIESKWGRLLKIGRFYSYFRFLLPWIWQSIDLTAYDLVITSCSGYIARGFKVRSGTKVVAYCHTPPRWLYGYETPTEGARKWWGKAYLTIFGPFVRYFDYMSAERVNLWVANSQEVAKRIRKYYRKEARVVYPPVELKGERGRKVRGDYYLTVARVVGAKGLELAAKVARKTKRKLMIVGESVGGKAVIERIREAGREWVQLTGRVTDEELSRLYGGAKGYWALAGDEDFGITAVEAMLHGTPVLALKSGGYKETVVEGETGILVEKNEVVAVAEGMEKLEKKKWERGRIIKWAETFNRSRFEKEIREVIRA